MVTAHTLAGDGREQTLPPGEAKALMRALASLLTRASPWATVVGLCAESLRRLDDTMPEHTTAACSPIASLHGSLVSDAHRLESLATGWLGTQKNLPTSGPYAACTALPVSTS